MSCDSTVLSCTREYTPRLSMLAKLSLKSSRNYSTLSCHQHGEETPKTPIAVVIGSVNMRTRGYLSLQWRGFDSYSGGNLRPRRASLPAWCHEVLQYCNIPGIELQYLNVFNSNSTPGNLSVVFAVASQDPYWHLVQSRAYNAQS